MLPPDVENVVQGIKNGIPLPKGHGKLGDLDIILNKAIKHREDYMKAENSSYCRGKLHAYELYVEEVENAPTIIEADKAESEDKMTYKDIYNEFCKKFPNAEVKDYRPAFKMYIPQLKTAIPNAILVWLNDGSELVFISGEVGENP